MVKAGQLLHLPVESLVEKHLAALREAALKGDRAQARRSFRAACLVAPGSPIPHLAWAMALHVFLFLADQRAALRAARRARDLGGGADALHVIALVQEQAGRSAAAIRLYRRAIAISPCDARLWFNYGELLFRQERTVEAMGAFERARALDPADADAPCFLGLAFEELGRVEEASALFDRALERSPGHPRAVHGLGRIRMRQGRMTEALDLLTTVVENLPNDPFARYDLGWTMTALGMIAEATEQAERAMELAPVDAPPKALRARCHLLRQEYGQARALLAEALAVDPNCDAALRELGWVTLHERDFETSREAWRQVLSRCPDDQRAAAGYAFACGGAGDIRGFERAKAVLGAVAPAHAAFWDEMRLSGDAGERAEQVFRVYERYRDLHPGAAFPVHLPVTDGRVRAPARPPETSSGIRGQGT
ncbi:MAG: tetratricopeptide repeat protein [Deltaproteobacteria bacterium]|nr:tetratricopeptide repeat protein [Deltaproteobacteria bacterium]